MYLEKDTADTFFSKVERRILFEELKIPVVSAEHLVAMKLFAAKHNERRRLKDLADIKEIISTVDINRKTVKDYFRKFGLESYYSEIESDNDAS